MSKINSLLLAGAIASMPLPAFAQLPQIPGLPAESLGALASGQGFTTSIEMTATGKMPVSRMTLYYSPHPERVRMELRLPDLDRSMSTIALLDEGVTYQEFGSGTWMRMPLPREALDKMRRAMKQANSEVKREILTPTTIDGRLCEVTRITQAGGGQTTLYSSKGIPVRVVQQTAQGNVTLRFVNFRQGEPQSGIFAPPPTTSVLDMGEMMKGELGDLLAE
ncbi:MAG TPA: hypothetical protein V6D00_14195 [Pantanalinema sp.]